MENLFRFSAFKVTRPLARLLRYHKANILPADKFSGYFLKQYYVAGTHHRINFSCLHQI